MTERWSSQGCLLNSKTFAGFSARIWFVAGARKRYGQGGHIIPVAVARGYLVDAFFFYLIDTDNGLQGDKGAPHTREFCFQFFLGWIHKEGRSFAKDQFLYFHKGVERPLADTAGVELVDISLIIKNNFVYVLVVHGNLVFDSLSRFSRCSRQEVSVRNEFIQFIIHVPLGQLGQSTYPFSVYDDLRYRASAIGQL